VLIQIDAKALEWVVCVYLSQDKVGIKELTYQDYDMHTENMKLFGFPSRGIAKIFIFRLIFGGTAYAYAHDSDFVSVSSSNRYWQLAIDAFYEKYKGVCEWHNELLETIPRTGVYRLPTGREFWFQLQSNKYNDDLNWPRTCMLNYPVQGLAAQLMEIARISAYRRLYNREGVLFINTVHDNIVLDVVNDDLLISEVSGILKQCLIDVPANFEKIYGIPFNCPLKGEIDIGTNWGQMVKVQ
jgi:DNA polymerase I-like protein with 3'-5' exonuclease and polymerase domains